MGKKKRKKKTTTPGAKQSFSKKEFQYLKECTEKSIIAAFEKYKLISIQQEMHPKKRVEVVAITTEEGKHLLLIGNETIEILNYTAKSSSDGATELFVTIKGDSVSTELSANLEE